MAEDHSNLERVSSIESEGESLYNKCEEVECVPAAYLGVTTAESAYRVFGLFSKSVLLGGLSVSIFLYSLDSQTSKYYVESAVLALGRKSWASVVQLTTTRTPVLLLSAPAVLLAAVYPIFAKIADVKSRGMAYAISLILYVLGYIIVAGGQNLATLGAGLIINAFGSTGLQLLSQVIIADTITLKWRGFASAAVSLLTIPNSFISLNVAEGFIGDNGVALKPSWRWGFGVFVIVVPAVVAPILFVLFHGQIQAKKTSENLSSFGLQRTTTTTVLKNSNSSLNSSANFLSIIQKCDLFGLILLVTSIFLVLFPLNLAVTANSYVYQGPDSYKFWTSGSTIAMFVCGLVLFPIFVIWEWRGAKYPVVPRAIVANRAAVVAIVAVFIDSFAFWVSFCYFYIVLPLQKPWSLRQLENFTKIHTIAFPIFGLIAGLGMRVFRRYKPFLVFGFVIRTIGVGMMVHSRGGDASDHEVIASQMLQGIGSAWISIAALVGAQASVPHVNTAMVTAFVLLAGQVGSVMGRGIGFIIWATTIPGKLTKNLVPLMGPYTMEQYIDVWGLMSNLPRSISPSVLEAYSEVIRTMAIIATCCSIFGFLCAFSLSCTLLGDAQNAVDGRGMDGELLEKTGNGSKKGSFCCMGMECS